MPRSADAPTTAAGRRRPSWSLAVVGLLALASVAFLWLQHTSEGVAASEEVPASRLSSGPSPAATAPRPVLAPRSPEDPDRLRIPALAVNAPVVPVRAVERTLVPPKDAMRLGWWADGARPGSVRGSALVTGHTVHSGEGALADLEQLRRGDQVSVRAGGKEIDYEVRSVEILRKGVLRQRAERLFAQDVPGRLVLITCEQWNGVEYLSNVVVTARPVPSSTP